MNQHVQKLRERQEPLYYRWTKDGDVFEIDNVMVQIRFLSLREALKYLRNDANWSENFPRERRCIVLHYRKIDGIEVLQAAYDIDGNVVEDAEAWWDDTILERFGPYHVRFRKDGGGRTPSVWGREWVSTAMKIHPSQVKQFNEEAKAAGTGCYYDAQGRCHAGSRTARSAEIKRRGYFDRQGGFGDYTGASREYMNTENGVMTPGHLG
jgi:hypothetical protein